MARDRPPREMKTVKIDRWPTIKTIETGDVKLEVQGTCAYITLPTEQKVDISRKRAIDDHRPR